MKTCNYKIQNNKHNIYNYINIYIIIKLGTFIIIVNLNKILFIFILNQYIVHLYSNAHY